MHLSIKQINNNSDILNSFKEVNPQYRVTSFFVAHLLLISAPSSVLNYAKTTLVDKATSSERKMLLILSLAQITKYLDA